MFEPVVANAHLSKTSEGHTEPFGYLVVKTTPTIFTLTNHKEKRKQRRIKRLGPESSQSSFIITTFIEGWSLEKGSIGGPIDFNRAERKRTVELTETISTAVAYYQATGTSKRICLTATKLAAFENTPRIPQCLFSLEFLYFRTQLSNLISKEHLSCIYLKNQAIQRPINLLKHKQLHREIAEESETDSRNEAQRALEIRTF